MKTSMRPLILLLLLLIPSPARAEEYVSQTYGVKINFPSDFEWNLKEETTTDDSGRKETLLGIADRKLREQNTYREVGNSVFVLAVFDYPSGSPMETMDLETYVQSSLTVEQELVEEPQKITVNGVEGVRYKLKETDPARYGSAGSLITLLRPSKNRIIEITASTIPGEYFDFQVVNFRKILKSLEIMPGK